MHLRIFSSIILLFALLFWMQKGDSQVVISPNVGVSYMPLSTDLDRKYKRADFLLGLTGRVQLTPATYFSCSFWYVNRKNVEGSVGLRSPGGQVNGVYKHRDINIDLIYQWQLLDFFILGIGGSLIYKLNTTYSEFTVYAPPEDSYFVSLNKSEWWKGGNVNLIYQLNPVEIKFRYSYFIDTRKYLSALSIDINRNRFDLMVSYPLEFGRKSSRRQQ